MKTFVLVSKLFLLILSLILLTDVLIMILGDSHDSRVVKPSLFDEGRKDPITNKLIYQESNYPIPLSLSVEDNSQKRRDVDLYPMYICPNYTSGVFPELWYGGCLDSCSVSTTNKLAKVTVWNTNSSAGRMQVTEVRSIHHRLVAHEGVLGGCYVREVSTNPTVLTEDIMKRWISDVLYSPKNVGASILKLWDDPECNYWSDTYSEGDTLSVMRYYVDVQVDIEGNLYFYDRVTGYAVFLNPGLAIISNRGLSWIYSPDGGQKPCYFTEVGSDYCSLVGEDNLVNCKNLGLAFHLNKQQEVKSSCAGILNVSTDGVIYSLSSVMTADSYVTRLASLWGTDPEPHLGSLIALMSSVFTELESAYCVSVCDIIEILMSNYPSTTTVLETPVGPWLPVRVSGHMMVVPCQAIQEFVIKFPLDYCFSKGMFRVINPTTGITGWWRIINTYMIADEVCVDDDSSEREQFIYNINNKKDVRFSFWRGDAVLSYPYENVTWESSSEDRVHRSSKWFPKIQDFNYTVNLSLENITDSLVNLTKDSVLVVNGTMGKIWDDSPVSQFMWLVIQVDSAVKNTMSHVLSAVQTIWFVLSQYKMIIFDVLITTILGYVMYKLGSLAYKIVPKNKTRRVLSIPDLDDYEEPEVLGNRFLMRDVHDVLAPTRRINLDD